MVQYSALHILLNDLFSVMEGGEEQRGFPDKSRITQRGRLKGGEGKRERKEETCNNHGHDDRFA